jgi:hypothetical protein
MGPGCRWVIGAKQASILVADLQERGLTACQPTLHTLNVLFSINHRQNPFGPLSSMSHREQFAFLTSFLLLPGYEINKLFSFIDLDSDPGLAKYAWLILFP